MLILGQRNPKKGKKPTGKFEKGKVFVAQDYPDWQEEVIKILQGLYQEVKKKKKKFTQKLKLIFFSKTKGKEN